MWKKSYAFLTFTNSTQKILEIWNVKDSRISVNQFYGDSLFHDACGYLLEMKKKSLEGIIFDLFEHEDSEFMVKLRKQFLVFCDFRGIPCRWIFRDVLFSTMLLYFVDESFKTEDSVITLWAKKDNYLLHRHKNGYLTQIDRIKLDDAMFEKKYDRIIEGNNPKFVVMGSSATVPSNIKKVLIDRKVLMLKYTFEECLQKSVSQLFAQLLRRTDKCRWNFKVQYFNAFKIQVKSDSGNLILKSNDDSLPSKSSLELPKAFSCIKGTTKFSFGHHLVYQKDNKKITVEVGEDGYIELCLPEKYCSKNFSVFEVHDNHEYTFYRSVQQIEDFLYISTTKSDEKKLQVWKVLTENCCKKEFSGETLLTDLKEYLLKFRSTAFDGIVFNLYEHDDPDFIWNAREELSSFCKLQKIPYKFITEESLFISLLLLKSRLYYDGKKLALAGYLSTEKRELNLFKINILKTKIDITERFQYKNLKTVAQDFSGFKPDYAIMTVNEKTGNALAEIFPSMKNFNETFEQCFISTSTELFLQLFTTKNSKWHFVSPPSPCFKLKAETNDAMVGFFGNDDIKKYPSVKTLTVPSNTVRLHVASEDKIGYFIDYSESTRITVDIAEDGFTQFCFPSKFAAFDGDSMIYKEMAKKLNATISNRKPVIVFPEDIAILFVYENGTYAPMEIDGHKEMRTIINFTEDEPVFGEKAAEKRVDNPFVVYDIMSIIKMDSTKLKKKSYWGFEIVHHEKYPLLFEFQTTNGLTHAPPSFLLAMFIKQMTKAYRQKTDHKLKDVMVPDIYENDFVLEQMKEALKLLNIKCTFVKL